MKILCILVLLFSELSVHATPAIDDGMPTLLKHIPAPKARVDVDIMFQPCSTLPPTSKKCSPLTPAQSQWIKTTFAKAPSPARMHATEIAALSQMIAALRNKKSEIFHAEFPQPSESFALSTYFDRKHLTVTIYATTTSLAPWILNCVESIVITPKLSWLKMGAAALATTGCLVGAFKATQRRSTYGPDNEDFNFINSNGNFEIQENTEVFKAIQSDSPERLKRELHRIHCCILWASHAPQELAAFLGKSEAETKKLAERLQYLFDIFAGRRTAYKSDNTLFELCLEHGGPNILEAAFLRSSNAQANIFVAKDGPTTEKPLITLWDLLKENFTTRADACSPQQVMNLVRVFLLGLIMCRRELRFDSHTENLFVGPHQSAPRDILIVCNVGLGHSPRYFLREELSAIIPPVPEREIIIANINTMIDLLIRKTTAQETITTETWARHLSDLQAVCQPLN